MKHDTSLTRAQGCLLGQLAGDALGSRVEFRSPISIAREYPTGVRLMANGGTFNTIAGQPTDDSEMALALARVLVAEKTFDAAEIKSAYIRWVSSRPFDAGMTVQSSLAGNKNPASEANGALMRISPLGIFGAKHDLAEVALWAQQDAELTHPNPVCKSINALFAMAIAGAIRENLSGQEIYRLMGDWAEEVSAPASVIVAIKAAEIAKPSDFISQMGWVLIAFQNALWQLLHATNLEEAIVDTINQGGDTDTNAAICGALLGAVYGRESIPGQWQTSILACRPERGLPGVHQPRPPEYWPVDALDLAAALLRG